MTSSSAGPWGSVSAAPASTHGKPLWVPYTQATLRIRCLCVCADVRAAGMALPAVLLKFWCCSAAHDRRAPLPGS